MSLTSIEKNCERIRRALAADTGAAGAAPPTVIAVAKTFSAEAVRRAVAAGFTHIGENYLQEAKVKIAALSDLPITWHFIGAIQKRKSGQIARLFDWAHTVDSEDIARRLSAARQGMPPLNVLIEINLNDEANKAGVGAEDALPLARAVIGLPHLRWRGLMAIPAASDDPDTQYANFRRLADLQETLRRQTGAELDTLSMGMSGDYPQALRAGATHIRLGTKIFGERAKAVAEWA